MPTRTGAVSTSAPTSTAMRYTARTYRRDRRRHPINEEIPCRRRTKTLAITHPLMTTVVAREQDSASHTRMWIFAASVLRRLAPSQGRHRASARPLSFGGCDRASRAEAAQRGSAPGRGHQAADAIQARGPGRGHRRSVTCRACATRVSPAAESSVRCIRVCAPPSLRAVVRFGSAPSTRRRRSIGRSGCS